MTQIKKRSRFNLNFQNRFLFQSTLFSEKIATSHKPLIRIRNRDDALCPREAGDGVRQIPVLALTASAMQADRELCRAAGMDDFLPKPLTLLSLSTALEHWLPHHPIANEAQGLRATVA